MCVQCKNKRCIISMSHSKWSLQRHVLVRNKVKQTTHSQRDVQIKTSINYMFDCFGLLTRLGPDPPLFVLSVVVWTKAKRHSQCLKQVT